jgi:hypothetical protein
MSGYSGHWGPETLVSEKLRMGNREATHREQLPGNSGCLSGYSRTLYPDIPDYEPDNLGIIGNLTRRLFIVRFDSHGFCRFS